MYYFSIFQSTTVLLEDNLEEDTEIIENIAKNYNQNNRRQKQKKPIKNTEESNIGTVFKSLRKRNSSSGLVEDIFKKPAASPVPPPSTKKHNRIALIAKESATVSQKNLQKNCVFTKELKRSVVPRYFMDFRKTRKKWC